MITSPLRATRETLGHFVAERQRVWDRYINQGLPRRACTMDDVIAGHHFTNIYRELDKGTQFARWSLYPAASPELILWRAVAYRLTNRLSVWREFRALSSAGRYPASASHDEWLEFLRDKMARGEKVFTGRHLTLGMRKYEETLGHLRDKWTQPTSRDPYVWELELRKIPGMGQFFTWQVLADLMMVDVVDTDSDVSGGPYVILGPGAKFALRWIRDTNTFQKCFYNGRRVVQAGNHMSDTEAVALTQRLVRMQDSWLWTQPQWKPWEDRPLTVVDVEHALCEYGRWGVLHARRELGLR